MSEEDTNTTPVADDAVAADEAAPVAEVSEEAPAEAGTPAPQASNEDSSKRKLFVGGISWGTTDEGLKAAFEAIGKVESAEVIREKMTGRSKGFGFVVMGSVADANAAVEKMNGQMLDGRQVTVNIARPKTEGDRRPMNRY